jgi:patatin-like phospholipase/acyl hydrolase
MADQFKLPAGALRPGPTQIKVLCLSGGGYRGMYSARVLARLEAILQNQAKGNQLQSIGDRFDLIVGTSIGGILACALSLGTSASKLEKLLRDHGPTIFPTIRFRSIRKLLGKAPYDAETLRGAINSCLGSNAPKVKLASHAKPLVLTSVDWTHHL